MPAPAAPLPHIVRVCRWTDSPDELMAEPCLSAFMRNRPKLIHLEMSLYWVVGRTILLRQPVLGFARTPSHLEWHQSHPWGLPLGPPVITEPRPWTRFRGWRYLGVADAPPDRPAGAIADDAMPPAMEAELQELGLL